MSTTLTQTLKARVVEYFNQLPAEQRTVNAGELFFLRLHFNESNGDTVFTDGQTDPTEGASYVGSCMFLWTDAAGDNLVATDSTFLLISIDPATIEPVFPTGSYVMTPATPAPIRTFVGDIYRNGTFPSINPTGTGEDYVVRYVAGVFSETADLLNITPADVRMGVIVTSNPDTTYGSYKVVHNGTVVYSAELSEPIIRCSLEWDCTITTAEDNLGGPKVSGAPLDWFDFQWTTRKWDGSESDTNEWYIEADRNTSWKYTFDNRDVKIGWAVQQHTGIAGAATNYPFYCDIPMMYTRPINTNHSDLWTDYFYSTLYNGYQLPADVGLKVTLGGDPAAWTTASTPNMGVYTEMGFPMSATGVEDTKVDGGTYDFAIKEIDTWQSMNSFSVGTDNLSTYVIPDQVSDAPSPWTGTRFYPGIAATSHTNDPYVQAINLGTPVVFTLAFVRNGSPT